jgi:hypothetical protein
VTDDDDLCECGHAIDQHAISAASPRLRCPECACSALISPTLQRATRLLQQGQVKAAQRVIDRAAGRH